MPALAAATQTRAMLTSTCCLSPLPALVCSEWLGAPLPPDMPQLRDLQRRLEAEDGYQARCTEGLWDVLEGHLPFKLWVSVSVSGSGVGWAGWALRSLARTLCCMHGGT
jgi:hypothetical protein